jgi:hypothetical protein
VPPEVWPFWCGVCGERVELRRGFGIGRVFDRGRDSTHGHGGRDMFILPTSWPTSS